jgi:predicted Zn-dependent protease
MACRLPRWVLRFLLGVLLVVVPRAFGQALPDLGDVSTATITPLQERRLGESIMREIRADRSYYDEPEAADYLNQLGQRLAARSTEGRQDFEFFLIQDSQINAFALPGGFIGVNTGLLFAAQSESELAGVMAHEISHVTQRHIARMLAQQKQALVTTLASIAAAILLSRVSSDAAQAAIAFGQASAIQAQLNFTRDHEREADRVGLQLLGEAGFDPRGMATFFERLQRATRVYETAAPSYLRTHPLPFERIADIQNRIQELPYRQIPDSIEFQLIRGEVEGRYRFAARGDGVLRGEPLGAEVSERGGDPLRAGGELPARQRPRARPQGARCGRPPRAAERRDRDALLPCRPRLGRAGHRPRRATAKRSRTYPRYRALVYDYADALLQARQPARPCSSSKAGSRPWAQTTGSTGCRRARTPTLNRPLAQHRALAEAFARQGNFGRRWSSSRSA